MNIVIVFKDGTEKRFDHASRAGGSYTKRVEYKGGFVIVTDEWDATWSYPMIDVKEVRTESAGGRW